jgi:hypothetical protein
VEIVLPDGYTGPVYLIEDETNGEDIPMMGGKYVVLVPTSGRMRVKSFAPFQRWHEETVRYARGTPIPSASSSNPDPSAVTKRVTTCGMTIGVTNIATFVGNDEQYAEYRRGPLPDLR